MSPRAKAELNAQKKREKRRREIRCNRANRIRNSRQEPGDFAGSPICPEIKPNKLGTRSGVTSKVRSFNESSRSLPPKKEEKKKKKEKGKKRERKAKREKKGGEEKGRRES